MNRGLHNLPLQLQPLSVEALATERGLVIHGIRIAFNAVGKLHIVPCSQRLRSSRLARTSPSSTAAHHDREIYGRRTYTLLIGERGSAASSR